MKMLLSEGPKLREGGIFNILDAISNNIDRIDLSGKSLQPQYPLEIISSSTPPPLSIYS